MPHVLILVHHIKAHSPTHSSCHSTSHSASHASAHTPGHLIVSHLVLPHLIHAHVVHAHVVHAHVTTHITGHHLLLVHHWVHLLLVHVHLVHLVLVHPSHMVHAVVHVVHRVAHVVLHSRVHAHILHAMHPSHVLVLREERVVHGRLERGLVHLRASAQKVRLVAACLLRLLVRLLQARRRQVHQFRHVIVPDAALLHVVIGSLSLGRVHPRHRRRLLLDLGLL